MQTLYRLDHAHYLYALIDLADRHQVRVLAFHRPLQSTLRVRIDRKDMRVKGSLGNACHQIVMGNGRVESCVAHGSLSVVVGMPGPLRAQGGVCSEMSH